MQDYLLGGDGHRAAVPDVVAGAWANRIFHHRAAIWMTQQPTTQFIDIGCGLPARTTIHALVRRVHPGARVAYADHDPMVIARAQALPTSGATAVVLADLRDRNRCSPPRTPTGCLTSPEPVGVLCTGVLHFVAGADDPRGCVHRLMAALAPSGCVALSHMTADHLLPGAAAACTGAYQAAASQLHLRARAEVEAYFDGLDLVLPYEGAGPGWSRLGCGRGCREPGRSCPCFLPAVVDRCRT
jgi:trans-aconitate methyltransferase